MILKSWPDCTVLKSLVDFPRHKNASQGHAAYCKPCHNARGQASRERAGGSQAYHLKRRYGITKQQYDDMLAAQGGLCLLCRERPGQHVDHDHLTKAVRGVLCSCCNQGLGNFRDDPRTLRRAIDYLEQSPWQRVPNTPGVFRRTSPHREARPSRTSSDTQRQICSLRAAISRQD